MPPKNTTKKRYQKMDQITHILTRSDMYVGSTHLRPITEYIAEKTDSGFRIFQKEITISPAILRIFIEPLSNAIDNVQRSKSTKTPCTQIKVTINKKTGETSVYNDGDVVPIEIDEDEKCYNHTMIFGQLLTGSNYDDEEERLLSGRNGLGGKLCNIFSKKFSVIGCDPKNKKILEQHWKNNMQETDGPKIKETNLTKGYTEITWTPDFDRFGLKNGYTEDIVKLYTRYVIDAAMLSKVDVYLNNEIIQINSLTEYAELYDTPTNEKIFIKTADSEVLLMSSKTYQTISFVNGVYTRLGGQHVDAWSEDFFRPIVDKFNGNDKKSKTPKININDVKQFFRLFVVSTVIRPEFDGQDKNKLESPQIKASVKRTHIAAICKWSIMDNIEDLIRAKEMVVLKKAERVSKNTKIEGYDPANKSGGKDSNFCSLFVTEGLSAKTYVVAGIEEGIYGRSGRDWNGILPVRGKLLNVREKNATVIASNKVICSLIHALGLKHGVDYTDDNNFKKLNYGRLVIVADADCFTKDTPLLIKKDGTIDVISCETLYKVGCENVEIWSKDGWTKMKSIICKETDKKILQITTGSGLIRCTEDHKMLLENGEEIKANKLKIGDRLLRTRRIDKPVYNTTDSHSNITNIRKKYQCYSKQGEPKTIQHMRELIDLEGKFCSPLEHIITTTSINSEESFVWGLFFAEGSCDIYTFEKNREQSTQKNTEKSRKRWLFWINKYETRIKKLSTKLNLDKHETRLLGDTKKRLKKALINSTRTSKETNKVLYRTNYCWAISNCDKELLEKSKSIMEKYYPEYSWTIIECTKKSENHSTPYKLLLNGGKNVSNFIIRMREMFYDVNNRAHKKVPKEILNSSLDVQQSFFDGYYAGDGFRALRDTKNASGFDILGQLGAQGLCVILERLGYCVNVHNKKGDIFTVHYSNKYRRLYPGAIKNINTIDYDDYVYDIETENHLLNAGIGGLILHNCDGIHIEGLILNFIHALYPSLILRNEPYVVSMKTPISRVFRKGKDLLFYDERRFNTWLAEQTTKVNTKYYKGLGTTKPEDVPDTFGLKMVEFQNDEQSFTNMQKAFHNKYADARKEWLSEYNPDNYNFSLDDVGSTTKMSLSNFVNGELIKFSHADCARSLPSGIDGLKESQRKILYAVKKRKLRFSGNSLKVAQLAGYTAEHSNYHHGEKNLFDTIIGMANEFPGTNNIPLLYRDGMFGTRLEGANDAADGRYIFTKMEALTELIFREEDEPLLTQVNDDGDLVQPEYYVPILPMILINGCTAGIGTGWSCKVPCYNPLDMINAIKIWLEKDGKVLTQDQDDETNIVSMFPEFIPWYRGFTGDIDKNSSTRFVTYGIVDEIKKGVVEVKELPIGMWTSNFSEFCEDLKSDKKLKQVSNYSSTKDVSFILTEADNFNCDLNTLKLHSYLYTSNMVMFDEKYQLSKYDTVDKILDNFCKVRYDYYIKRKSYQIKSLQAELRYLSNKERFVKEVIKEELIIMNTKEEDIVKTLKERGYDEDPKKNDDEGGYDYLLRMQIRTFTADKVKQIKNDIVSSKQKISDLKAVSEKQIWINELEEFEKAYKNWLEEINNQIIKTKNRQAKNKQKK